jgi:hypothetical protein
VGGEEGTVRRRNVTIKTTTVEVGKAEREVVQSAQLIEGPILRDEVG